MAGQEEQDKLKLSRRQYKAAITKFMNKLTRLMAEKEVDQVKDFATKMSASFKKFEETHESYVSLIDDIDVSEEEDKYFFAVEKDYADSLIKVQDWLGNILGSNTQADSKSKIEDSDVKPSSSLHSEMMGLMTFSKVKVEPFKGDPLRYHTFIATFEQSVEKVTSDDKLRLTKLLELTKGIAYDAIQPCILMKEGGYREARSILQKRFGNQHLVVQSVLNRLRHGKEVRTAEEMRALSDQLSSTLMIVDQIGKLKDFDCQNLISEIVGRFPSFIRDRWRTRAVGAKIDAGDYLGLNDMVKFIEREVEVATDPVYGNYRAKGREEKFGQKKTSVASSSFATGTFVRPPCVMCSQEHKLIHCEQFKSMMSSERVKFVKNKGLCEICLYANHATENCRSTYVCNVTGCGKKHSKFLHVSQSNHVQKGGEARKVTNANIDISGKPQVFMPVVSVQVNTGYKTSALLDTVSSSTFCSSDLVKMLGISGKVMKYTLNTLNKSNEAMKSEVVNISVSSLDGRETIDLVNVLVVERIPVSLPAINISSFQHLKGLAIPCTGGNVQILIGQDHAEALVPLEVRRGNKGEPFAVRSMLGWTLNGPNCVVNPVGCNVISHFVSARASVDSDINVLWNVENEGITDDTSWSIEDKNVIKLWDSECRLVDGRYQIPIPWKSGVQVPNNYIMALSRLKATKRSLVKRSLYAQYDGEMQKLISKGYAERVVDDMSESRVWYLPHQAVVSDKKPGKIRIVFDCAAKFNGESLNEKCFQGPNLSNSLLNVLLRFREHSYAMVADIEAMYYQVVIPKEDRDALRFLWFDDSGEIVCYRMTRHVFGGIWCSSSSTYALRRVLFDNDNIDPLVSDVIRRSFYVDDCLKSLPCREQVLDVVRGTIDVLSQGGFHLTKFMINDEELLNSIPIGERASDVEFLKGLKGKVLGIGWNVESDEFCFQVNLDPGCEVALTRRKMLSMLASIYDPLGLVSPVIICGKLLLQEATTRKLSWDERVPDDLLGKWLQWYQSLSGLQGFGIPRCIKPFMFNDAALELHHFSDASQVAYGCSSYLRSINKDSKICVALIISKSKVAPIKSLTIPRLELQAAVLAAKMDATLRGELDLDLGPSHFWTDSEIVLRYIANESRRFHVFVGNRVSVIQQHTQPDQWHFVAGVENPADLLTRGESPGSLQSSRWLIGPQFLHCYKADWKSKQVDASFVPLNSEDPEVRTDTCLLTSNDSDPMDKLVAHHSSWYSLKRAVAWLLKFKSYLRNGRNKIQQGLNVELLRDAEISILRHAQSCHYQSDIKLLSKGQGVSKSSALCSLDPVLDNDGIVRIGGRLKHARMVEDTRCPYLVPHDHSIAKLIVADFHNVAHCGTEWVLCEIRKRYWITRARRLVKSVSHGCMFCKKMFAQPCSQKMADLPPERVEDGNRPFTYTGMDGFGPFLVKQGRAEVKRYGCLFTCMNTRAVHIEKLNTLETDSFLNAFRRFVSRRGVPKKVWSDNGTNFAGGCAEILRNLKEVNQQVLHEFGLRLDLQWHFNPPAASHMGGAWERLIRTVRKVLLGLLGKDCRLSDEGLETLFCEVEFIVNGRPITKVSDSVLDAPPLTPNHLLMLSESVSLPPGVFIENDLYRRRWRQVQHLANTFWRRWLREYLPELQVRAKWHQTKANLKARDLVLVFGENTPRGLWPMGVVEEVYESDDGNVRSASVRTKSSLLTRPVTKLVLLEGSI